MANKGERQRTRARLCLGQNLGQAHIDPEGLRIENKLERALGRNGWAVICRSNARGHRPGTLVPHDGQQPAEVRW